MTTGCLPSDSRSGTRAGFSSRISKFALCFSPLEFIVNSQLVVLQLWTVAVIIAVNDFFFFRLDGRKRFFT